MVKINKLKLILSQKVNSLLIVCTLYLSSVNLFAASSFEEILNINNVNLSVRINQYDKERYNQMLAKYSAELTNDVSEISCQGSQWIVNKQVTPLEKSGKYKIVITFKCLTGEVQNASVSVDMKFTNWSRDNYVLMPAAVYNGNRYETIRMDKLPSTDKTVYLYEATNDQKWLIISQEMANQFASWVMAYDYKFAKNSTLGKMDTHTTGLVFANTQNNTACPSICSSSGIALLKLYRATQNPFYLNMLSDITYAITQYMSYPGHEIPGYHDGWIYERGGTSDWDNAVGEIHAAASFPSISLMLSYVELPGVYVNKTTKEVFTIDQVNARLNKKGQLEITNPTRWDAIVKVFAETEDQMKQPLVPNAFLRWKKVKVKAGGSLSVDI